MPRATADARPMPVHVTLRMAPHVYNLRSRRSFRVVAVALRSGGDRFNVRVVHFSVQGNHIHLLVEAPTPARSPARSRASRSGSPGASTR
jgi:REP element-mobilizing transposase RayT